LGASGSFIIAHDRQRERSGWIDMRAPPRNQENDLRRWRFQGLIEPLVLRGGW
jgi:hypothetical protein